MRIPPSDLRANTGVSDLFRCLPPLKTPRLFLRRMTVADADDMCAYAADPQVSRYTLWEPHRSLQETIGYLRFVERNYEMGAPENWGMVLRQTERLIGTCGFFSWDRQNRRAEINYAMSRAHAGQGLMSEAVRAVVGFGFQAMELNRIEARCMPENTASEKVLLKTGFVYEGTVREACFTRGRFTDLKSFAILRSAWREQVPSP